MWCERFMSAYRGTPVARLSEHYGRTSLLVETACDERWTEPVCGARDIGARLAELDPAVNGWPVVACQRTPPHGMIVVTARPAGGNRDRQILVVHRSAAGGAVVRNHFYVAAGSAPDLRPPFHGRFETWAASLDRAALRRHRAALHAALSVVREYYARRDGRSRWHQYDPKAKFSCTRNGVGDARVSIGPRAIRRRYAQLALDYRTARARAVDTCWSVAPDAVAVLVAGTVPEATCAAAGRADREFAQFFVIDTRTRKILNDVLSVDDGRGGRAPSSRWPPLSLAVGGVERSPSASSSSPSSSDGRSPSTSLADAECSTSDGDDVDYDDYDDEDDGDEDQRRRRHHDHHDHHRHHQRHLRLDCGNGICDNGSGDVGGRRNAGELAELRTRLTANGLKIRHVGGTAGQTAGQTTGQTAAPANNTLNPRQLFIGCVPLHVKYGQLKLLFEQFGEVTYVKVYESYSKQTGVKMMHNYAFLFFKNEASVDRAIAASPVPLDANWNLNVSRPLRHTAPAVDER